MMPILYDSNETAFWSNGICRLRDCIRCECVEERNGIYEVEIDYPVDGANFEQIQCGRVVVVEHDESDDLQPFDIYAYTKPINGVVTFYAHHISYRQADMVSPNGQVVSNLTDAFNLLKNSASPTNPFTYETDMSGSNNIAAFDGPPQSVRSMLGGIEGSILDAYHGEYEWDKFNVKLWDARGELTDLVIRYGVNMLDFTEETDYSGTYSAVIAYWHGQDSDGNEIVVKTNMIDSGLPTNDGRTSCIPLDVTDKFEEQPTVAQLEAYAQNYLSTTSPHLPQQNIKVDFARLKDYGEYQQFERLQECKLCDSVRVEFPKYNVYASFKIVRTVYDVLAERYSELELGSLKTSLAAAIEKGTPSAGQYTSAGGSGGGGTKDYNRLLNRPSIEGVTLVGDKTFEDLNLGAITNTEIYDIVGRL